jgi:hypothetical protein
MSSFKSVLVKEESKDTIKCFDFVQADSQWILRERVQKESLTETCKLNLFSVFLLFKSINILYLFSS